MQQTLRGRTYLICSTNYNIQKRLIKVCNAAHIGSAKENRSNRIHDCNSLQYAILHTFCFRGPLLFVIWTHKKQATWEYIQATWFVKMVYSVTILWSGTFLFSLLWCCKVVTTSFEQLHTRVYDRATKIAEFMSATCRGSKVDFFAVVTILCSIEWPRLAVGN